MGSSVFKSLLHSSSMTNMGLSYIDLLVYTLGTLMVMYTVMTFTRLLKMRWASEKAFAKFSAEKRHPIFGHLDKLNLNAEETMQMAADSTILRPYANQLWFGPFHSVLVCYHPSTVQPILSTAEPKDEFMYGLVKPWLGDGLLISKGRKWHRNRRLLTPGFHFDILKPYVKVFNECANTMVDKWMKMYDDGPLEMFEHVSLNTLDGLFKCIFSIESQCQTERTRNPYISAVYDLSGLILQRLMFPPYFSDFIYHLSQSGYTWRKALKTVHYHSSNVIKQRREAMKEEKEKGIKNNRKYIDFLDILLEARDEDGNGLTDQEIRDEVDTFMFEGHDTTASGLSWIMYNLARHPEHQQKCQQEIDDLLDQKGSEELEWDDLAQLPYLTMCIKESLRLHPPVPFIVRKTTKAITIPSETGKATIPAGERVGISIISLHHNVHVWEDPEIYDPLRFTPENTKNRSPHAYVPFSAGPRNCIGQLFAMNEMKITAAMVLRNFNLSIDDFKVIRRYNAIILRSEGGLPVYVSPRKPIKKCD